MSDEALVDRIANGLNRAWWLPLVRGLLMLVLGLLLRIEPLIVFDTVVVVFGLFLIIDGAVAAIYGLVRRHEAGAHWWLAQAVVGAAFGLVVLLWPYSSVTALYYLLVVWALALGVLATIGSVALVRIRDLAWPWLLVFGLVATLFGLMLLVSPQDSLAVVVLVFGIFALVAGAIHVVSAFAVRDAQMPQRSDV